MQCRDLFIILQLDNCSNLYKSCNCSNVAVNIVYGVPQGSILAPMLFNIYIRDISDTLSKTYSYADYIAILASDEIWSTIESRLTVYMHILSTYLKNWRLKPSAAKILFSAFHLYNKVAYRELNIEVNKSRLQFQASPRYVEVKLDRSLTFCQHLKVLLEKKTALVALIHRLACTTWDASTKTSCISAQTLVFFTVEYCVPVWC